MSNWFRFGHLEKALIKWLLCNNIEHFIANRKCNVTIERFNIEHWNTVHYTQMGEYFAYRSNRCSNFFSHSLLSNIEISMATMDVRNFFFQKPIKRWFVIFIFLFVLRPYTKVWCKQFESIFVVLNFSLECDIFPVGVLFRVAFF